MSLEAGCAAHLAPRPAHATTEYQHSAAIARVTRMALSEPLSAAEEAAGQRSRFAQHIHLFREGDPASHVYQLTEGAVMLYKLLPDGRRSIVEVLINTGDVFGLSSSPLYDCSAETLVAGGAISFDRATITSAILRHARTRSLAGAKDRAGARRELCHALRTGARRLRLPGPGRQGRFGPCQTRYDAGGNRGLSRTYLGNCLAGIL
jgi:CRP-like cAMP-binding protein